MPRTTLDLDPAVLRELKRRRDRDGKPMGVIASELLAGAFATEEAARPGAGSAAWELGWSSARLGAKVDIEDKDALRQALDGG